MIGDAPEIASGSPQVDAPFAGRIENWFDRAIAGHAMADDSGAPPTIEFRIGDRIVGRVTADLPHPQGFGFAAVLPLEGGAVPVSAHRLPDGTPLAGSPVLLHPGAAAAPAAAAGRIEDWFDRAIAGVVAADADGGAPMLDIRVAGRSVAQVSADQRRPDGLFAFAAIVPVGSASVSVSAYRMSDGRRLDPAAVLLNPMPGRVENWLRRRISGHAPPDEHGLPPTIEFRVGGEIIASVVADQPRPDGYGFATLLPIDGPAVEVSAHLLPDGRMLANSPVLLHPDPPAPPPPPPAWDAPSVTPKPFVMPAHRQVALFVAHSASGVVPPHVPACLAALRQAGLAVHLIAAVDRPIDLPPALLDLVTGAMVRAGAGHDFAAWSHALKLSPEIYGADTLYLLNDSLFGPADPAGLAALLARVRDSAADLVALTARHAPRWHVQNHFLALKPRLLASAVLHRFMRDAGSSGAADEGVPADTLRFGPAMEAAGHSIEVLFREQGADPILPGGRTPGAAGLPFVTLNGALSDSAGWREALALAGFDVPLLERTLAAAAGAVPDGGDGGLLVHPAEQRSAVHPLRIAFLGSWAATGANGYGSRAILATLRRTGAVLNLHPIEWAQGASPPDAIRDFTGPVDVALLHLDLGAPEELSDDTRRIMALADRSIGYVTADVVPAGWIRALPLLDRIWVADAALAAIPGGDGVPVEIMPLSSPAAAFDAAFRAALAEPSRASGPARIGGDLARGIPFADLAGSATLRIVAVATDGTVPPVGPVDDAETTWFAFAPADALAAPQFARAVRDHARAQPNVAIFYADDVALGEAAAIDQLRLKPEFDPVLLTAQDHIGWPLIVRAATFAALGGFDAAKGAAAGDDLLFRAHARGMSIGRIPLVLIGTRGPRRRIPAETRRAMLAAQPALADHAILAGAAPGLFVRRRRFDAATMPPVSLLVYGGGAADRLLDTIAATDWPMDRLTLIVSEEPHSTESDRPFAVRRIARAVGEPRAERLNRLWRAAETEHVVLLSSALIPQAPGWLRALQTFALDSDVGGVGALVTAADGTIVHAGVAPIGGAAGPLWRGRRGTARTTQDWAFAQREWSMVGGAAFATRRSVLGAVNGFDPRFTRGFGDYDLCLRIRGTGMRIVYTPEAAFVRTEATAEPAPTGEEVARFRGRWGAWLEADPAFHPGYDPEADDLAPRVAVDAWYR